MQAAVDASVRVRLDAQGLPCSNGRVGELERLRLGRGRRAQAKPEAKGLSSSSAPPAAARVDRAGRLSLLQQTPVRESSPGPVRLIFGERCDRDPEPHLLLSYWETVLDTDLRAFGPEHSRTVTTRAEYERFRDETLKAGAPTCSRCGVGQSRRVTRPCDECGGIFGMCDSCGRCVIGHCAPKPIGFEGKFTVTDIERVKRDGQSARCLGPAPCSWCLDSGEPCACNDEGAARPLARVRAGRRPRV